MRKEVEQCDRLTGILTMMSLAGGTGSGMGTFITQCLRDMYPHTSILNHVTWPYNTGEVMSWKMGKQEGTTIVCIATSLDNLIVNFSLCLGNSAKLQLGSYTVPPVPVF